MIARIAIVLLAGIVLTEVTTCYQENTRIANLRYEQRDATPCYTARDWWDQFDNSDTVDDRFSPTERPVCDGYGQFKRGDLR